MSYDLPFLSSAQRKLKKLRQQTEVDYAAPARAPRTYGPDIATPQQPALEFLAQPQAPVPPSFQQDVAPVRAPRAYEPDIPTPQALAGPAPSGAPPVPRPEPKKISQEPGVITVQSREAAYDELMDSMNISKTPEPGSVSAIYGQTRGLREPLDFRTGAGPLGEIAGLGLGLLHVAGAFIEPVQQPLDILANSGINIVQGQTPTLLTEGYTASLGEFRDRSWWVQFISSAVTELGAGAVVGIPLKTLNLSSRAAKAGNGVSRTFIADGAVGVNKMPTQISPAVTSSANDLHRGMVDLVQDNLDDMSRICMSECIDEIGENVLGLENIQPGLSGKDTLDNTFRGSVGKIVDMTQHDPQVTPIIRHALDRQEALGNISNSLGEKINSMAHEVFDIDERQLIPSLAGKDITLPKGLEHIPSLQDVAARLDIFRAFLNPDQLAVLEVIRLELAPWRQLLDDLNIPMGARKDVTGDGFYIPRGDAKEVGEELLLRVQGRTGVGGGKQGFELAEQHPSMSSGVLGGQEYASLGDTIKSYINGVGDRSIGVHTANQLKRMADKEGKLFADTAALRLERQHPTMKNTILKWRNGVRSRFDTLRRQEAGTREAVRALPVVTKEAREAAARTGRAEERLTGVQAEFLVSDRRAAEGILAEAHKTRGALGEEIKDMTAQIRQAQGKLDNVEEGWAAAAMKQLEDLGEAAEYTRWLHDTRSNLSEGYYVMIDEIVDMNGYIDELLTLRDNLGARVDGLISKKVILRELDDEARDKILLKNAEVRASSHMGLSVAARKAELKLLRIEEERATRRAIRAEKLVGVRTERMANTAQKLARLQDQLDDINESWKNAISYSQQPGKKRGTISMPGLQGHDFPSAMANAAEDIIKGTGALQGAGFFPIQVIKDLSGMMLGLKATWDDSVLFIQGLASMAGTRGGFGGPMRALLPAAASKQFAQVMMVNMKAWADPKVLGAFIKDFDNMVMKAGRLKASEWGRYGLRIGGDNTEFSLGRGVFKSVEKLPLVKRANRSFGYFGDARRLQWADDMLAEELSRGRSIQEIIRSGDMARISEITNNMTGWSRHKVGGSVGDMVLLAPRYFASRLETVFKAAMGGVPWRTQTGWKMGAQLDQRMARRTMLRLVGGAMAITAFVNWQMGKETDYRPIVNGRWNPNFNRIHAMGRDISLLGPYDSIGRLLTGLGTADFGAIRGMTSGPVSNMWDFLSGYDFEGHEVRSPLGILKRIASNALPFAAEDGAEGIAQAVQRGIDHDWKGTLESVGGVVGEFVGIKSSIMSMSDIKQQVVNDIMGRKTPEERAAIEASMDMTPYDRMSGQDYLFHNLPTDVRNEAASDPRVVAKGEAMPDRLPPIEEQVNNAVRHYNVDKGTHIAKLGDSIAKGMVGKTLKQAIQEYKQNLYQTSVTLFRDDTETGAKGMSIKEYLERHEPANAEDVIRSAYWSVPLDMVNTVTPLFDYDKRDSKRAEIVDMAKDAGISDSRIEVITSRLPTGNDVVDRVLEQYETDMETLKPLWDLEDSVVARRTPYAQALWIKFRQEQDVTQHRMREDNKVIRDIEKAIRNARQMMRADDSMLDVTYVRWGYGQPQTWAGEKEWKRMGELEQAATQALPAQPVTP